jgi:erythromycin esterase-like protein
MQHSSLLTLPYMMQEVIQPLPGTQRDYDTLMDFIGDARLVLLGEATHGTHEFYQARAHITSRLICEKG